MSKFLSNDCFSGALEEDEWKDRDGLSTKQKHLLKHRELFLSRQVENLPATQIRGKCSVTLLNETESLLSYLNKDVSRSNKMCEQNFGKRNMFYILLKFQDTYFYSLVYDPQQKTLLADRGEIRVGQRYQAEGVKPKLKEGGMYFTCFTLLFVAFFVLVMIIILTF